MRVPMEWLRSLTPLQASADDVAERLAAAGFEVDTIHRTSEHWDDVVVGEVVKIDPHPDADRLNLPTVRFGAHELQVVCGAWNFKEGDKIPFAQVGARLWDPYSNQPKLKELKPSKIRGVVSRGMLCSPKELGLSDEHEGIVILDGDATVGAPLAEVLGDEVIEFELKPNRPDALSMLGIAREAAALFATPLRVPGPDADDSRASLGLDLHIDIEDPELCPRYAAAFVVDGGIYRHDFVAQTVVDGLMRVGLDCDLPVLSVSLTPHHYQETDHHNAIYRDHFVTKGREAAQAALGMTQALETFSSKENGAEISKISAA